MSNKHNLCDLAYRKQGLFWLKKEQKNGPEKK